VISGTPTAAGTFTFTVTATNTLDDVSETFSITIAPVTATVTTAPTTASPTYNGTAQALVSAGTASGGTMKYSLTSGGTYTTAIPTGTNAGSYTVYYIVEGDANHTNSAEASVPVTIGQLDLSTLTPDPIAAVTYNGTAQTPVITSSGVTFQSGDIAYTYSATNIDAGTATVTASAGASGNCINGAAPQTFTINPFDLSNLTLASISNVTYDGMAHTPAPVITSGGIAFLPTDTVHSYANNIDAGTATPSMAAGGMFSFWHRSLAFLRVGSARPEI
jgi:hypothetical protein